MCSSELVYITTNGVGTYVFGNDTYEDELDFGLYQFGSRSYFLTLDVTVAKGSDVTDFPLFPSDMTNRTQSVIAVPPNVPVDISYGRWKNNGPGFTVAFKIIIQRPIDPSFSYNITYG